MSKSNWLTQLSTQRKQRTSKLSIEDDTYEPPRKRMRLLRLEQEDCIASPKASEGNDINNDAVNGNENQVVELIFVRGARQIVF